MTTMAESVEDTLRERERYGDYRNVAQVAQGIKLAMKCGASWDHMTPHHRESLDMIANKIARVVCGDSNYIDNWHDIIGYATLVENVIVYGHPNGSGRAIARGSEDADGPLGVYEVWRGQPVKAYSVSSLDCSGVVDDDRLRLLVKTGDVVLVSEHAPPPDFSEYATASFIGYFNIPVKG